MSNSPAKNRQEIIEKLKDTKFDLLIIGGGITGAGIALDAASRGMKVALIEKGDFASGTSSKSTKLIHGGLRYLKQFEIGLVMEVGRERAIVHRLAPHLVKAEKMLLPIIKGGTYGKWGTSFGLWLYDLLAGVKGDDRRKMLSKHKTLTEEPLLRKTGLLGSGLYAEYRTDDARLTIEIIKTAVRYGAVCLNYTEVVSLLYDQGQIRGGVIQSEEGNFHISADQVVSAAGPWVDEIRKIDLSLKGKHLFLSKGVHVVVEHERLPLRHSVYFDVPGGRMLFAIPRQRATYIGTTDTPFKGNPNHVSASKADIDYLLDGANAMFPSAKLTTKDVESTWAGLRPLIYEEGKSASEMSRKDEIFLSSTGLISIAGGKLTGYRKMAKKVVNLVCKRIRKESGNCFNSCKTHKIPITKEPFLDSSEVQRFQDKLQNQIACLGLPIHTATYLVENYGRDAEEITTRILGAIDPPPIALVKSELKHCIENEFVYTTLDFLERRSGRLYFDSVNLQAVIPAILETMQSFFNWDKVKIEQERTVLKENLHWLKHFDE